MKTLQETPHGVSHIMLRNKSALVFFAYFVYFAVKFPPCAFVLCVLALNFIRSQPQGCETHGQDARATTTFLRIEFPRCIRHIDRVKIFIHLALGIRRRAFCGLPKAQSADAGQAAHAGRYFTESRAAEITDDENLSRRRNARRRTCTDRTTTNHRHDVPHEHSGRRFHDFRFTHYATRQLLDDALPRIHFRRLH